MPRKQTAKRVEVSDSDMEEDYLEVDKPIPGQNFVCLSFVSPDKLVVKKDAFYAYHYHNYRMTHYRDLLKTKLGELLDSVGTEETIPLDKLVALRKSLKTEFEHDVVNYSSYASNLEDFRYREEEKLNAVFDKEHNFQTSVRGLKVRGVYDSKSEADNRAAALQRSDQSFDVFVGQVGYWLPWDPCSTKVENQEYLNKDLNNLVKEYKSNEAKKDIFYQEQKQSRAKDAISTADRLRHKLAMKKQQDEEKALEASKKAEGITEVPEVSETQQSVSLGDLNQNNMSSQIGLSDLNVNVNVDNLMEEKDPWLQAKERQQAEKAEQSTQQSSTEPVNP
jgi:hypothetical protein